MNSLFQCSPLVAAAAALAATSASAQTVVIFDDFEVDTSADYTIVDDGTPDGTQTFAYDYIAAGIPLAPGSNPGDTGGLRLTANDTGGATDAITCFHNTMVNAPLYVIEVDVYMNFDPTGSGTTEFGHIGVAGDSATYNSLFTPISGSGAFIAFTGDGGSSSDFRWFRDPLNTPPGDTATTTLPNSHPSYLNRGSNASGAYFQTLFPSPPSEIAGSPGNVWTTVEILVDNTAGLITFLFDGSVTYHGEFAGMFNGAVSLGLADVFTSLGTTQFTIYDNLLVETVEPFLGTTFCTSNPNSTLNETFFIAEGSDDVVDNEVNLFVSVLPQNAMGYFVTSQTQGSVINPGGSEGILCLGGAIGRYVGPGQVLNSDRQGSMELSLDLTQTPTPTGLVPVAPGETWSFQLWHRDMTAAGAPSSNFSSAIAITFQ